MSVALPDDPGYYTRVEMVYRYTDADNHWRAYLEYTQAGVWAAKLDKVASGTRTNLVTVADVGTPDGLRVIATGNDHTLYTRAGGVYTQRGATQANSAHASATSVGTAYNGPTTALVDDSFENWTGDDPDDWTSYSETAGNFVTEVAQGMRFVVDGVSYWQTRPTLTITSGASYVGVVTIDSITGVIRQRFGFRQQFLDGVGVFAAREVANGTNYVIGSSSGAADAVISRVELYEVGALSDGNGPTRLDYTA